MTYSQFDLLLSDQQLPDGTGTDLLETLRAHGPVKAICLSGEGSEAEISRSLEAGFHRHLTKPVPFPQLQQAIAEALDT